MDKLVAQKIRDVSSALERVAIEDLFREIPSIAATTAGSAITRLAPSSPAVDDTNGTSPPTMSSTTAERPAAQRPSFFLLPRELRDEIYGYLLDGTCTASGKDRRDAFSIEDRRFHTNILATNRTIRDEAEKIMAEQNVFVLIKMNFKGIKDLTTKLPWIRVVSKHRLERFRGHHLSVRISGECQESRMRAQQGPSHRKLLLLLEDLPLFYSAMRVILHRCNGNSTHMQSLGPGRATGVLLHDREPGDDSLTSASIRFFDTQRRRMTWSLCTTMLETLKGLAIRRMNTTVSGQVMDQQLCTNLINILSPSLIYTYAHYWQLLESLYDAKSAADKLIGPRTYGPALDILHKVEWAAFSVAGHLHSYLPSDLSEVAISIRVLAAETQATICYLLLRQSPTRLYRAWEMATRLRHCVNLLDPMYRHNCLVTTIHHLQLLESMTSGTRAAFFLLREYEGCPCAKDMYIRYDLAYLHRKFLRCINYGARAQITIDFDALSAYVLPPRVFNSHLKPVHTPVPSRPSYVVGLLDTQHLAQLTPEEKRNIHDWRVLNHTLPGATETLLD